MMITSIISNLITKNKNKDMEIMMIVMVEEITEMTTVNINIPLTIKKYL